MRAAGGGDYEWDDDKAIFNLRRYGIDFVETIGAPEDPNRLEQIDMRFGTRKNGFRPSASPMVACFSWL